MKDIHPAITRGKKRMVLVVDIVIGSIYVAVAVTGR